MSLVIRLFLSYRKDSLTLPALVTDHRRAFAVNSCRLTLLFIIPQFRKYRVRGANTAATAKCRHAGDSLVNPSTLNEIIACWSGTHFANVVVLFVPAQMFTSSPFQRHNPGRLLLNIYLDYNIARRIHVVWLVVGNYTPVFGKKFLNAQNKSMNFFCNKVPK